MASSIHGSRLSPSRVRISLWNRSVRSRATTRFGATASILVMSEISPLVSRSRASVIIRGMAAENERLMQAVHCIVVEVK